MTKIAPQTTIRADRDEWIEMLGTDPAPSLLDQVGISAATWRAILAGRAPLVPIACARLARFHRFGDLCEVGGPDWRGFALAGGALSFPGLRRPIPAAELRSVWASVQELAALRLALDQSRRDTARALAACEAAEARAWYYRRQLVAESRLGLMLSGA